ncbi:MAG: YicC/YloC family endoribonuclease, partial [Terriglobia bacterium]
SILATVLMLRSMTGYSSGRAEEEKFAVSVNLKSVNHRFLDLQFRLPSELVFFEPTARRLLRERLLRGHVEVTASFERAEERALPLDRRALALYLSACQKIREASEMAADLDVVALLRIPGILKAEEGFSAEDQARLETVLEKAFLDAAARLNKMREGEGEVLTRDLEKRLKRLQELGFRVGELVLSVPGAFEERLESRLQELLKGAEVDASRLAQEVALLSSRSDITEEVTRFRSHVTQAQRLLEQGEEAGKKLDFLLQEMNREANTLLSKTTDVPRVGMKIAESAIEMKVEIEKLREQAQNIE